MAAAATPEQQPTQQPPTWLTAIDSYLAGDYATATVMVDAIWREDVARRVAETLARLSAEASKNPVGSAEHSRALQRLQGAVLMPLEALLPLSARVADDPRFVPLEDAVRQALGALAVLERSRAGLSPSVDVFRLWAQVALMQFLLNSGQLGALESTAADLRIPEALTPLRAEYCLLRGMAHERSARLVTSVRSPGHTYLGPGAVYGPGGQAGGSASAGTPTLRSDRDVVARRYFKAAADWYERALDMRPAHEEARLHLGRTWLERQRPEKAIETLAPLVRRSCASSSCALALLFTGEAHEMGGASDLAGDYYRQASELPATRQTAIVAAMHLLLRRGGAGTLPLALQFRDDASTAQHAEPDAWGVYVGGRRADVDALLEPMRRGLSR